MYIVIMAGGSGTRFWPASKEDYPKQFLNIISDKTLIEETFLRIRSLAKKENHIIFVVNKNHEEITRKIFSKYDVKIIVEPHARNTTACIGLAAMHIQKEAGNQPFIVMPADHFISDIKAFKSVLQSGVNNVKDDQIIVFGIVPTRPETGYGYIKFGKKLITSKEHNLYKVKEFVEKPNIENAKKFLQQGGYLWNSGIFAFNTNTILKEIKKYQPDMYTGLQTIQNSIGTDKYDDVVTEIYQQFKSISIDYGIMEKTNANIMAIKGDFGWSDVGSWQSLYLLKNKDMDSFGNVFDCDSLNMDCKNIFVFSRSPRLISTLGLQDILIVDMPDTLLVADINKSQDVRKIVEEIKKREDS